MTRFDGPIVAFGDLGDEFGKVPGVLTFNVNEVDPNSFRKRNVAAVEAYNWKEVPFAESSINNRKEVFFRGEKVEVIRDKSGQIIRGKKNKSGYLELDNTGPTILAAMPITRGGGEATAEILERLVDVGYFNTEE